MMKTKAKEESPMTHPQRCETCSHFVIYDDGRKLCKIIKDEVSASYQIGIPFYMDIVGCASHSASKPVLCDNIRCADSDNDCRNCSLQVTDPVWKCTVCGAITTKSHEHKYQEVVKQARREERERVLDEGTSRIDEFVGSLEDSCVDMQMIGTIQANMIRIETFREAIGILESLRGEQR